MELSSIRRAALQPVVFRYRGRELTVGDIEQIAAVISCNYRRGRSHIAHLLCRQWNWVQANGQLKEYAARDLLLRLEEKGLIELPPRLRPKNNSKQSCFAQRPLFVQQPLQGQVNHFVDLQLRLVTPGEDYLWGYLLHHYHYLGCPRLVGEYLKYVALVNGQIVACLAWASAAFKVKDRDDFIGWPAAVRRQRLHLVANNVRFLVLPWIQVKHLASKLLALNLRCLSRDWQQAYNHGLYLVETFVDRSRFEGTCYRAANWQHVGQTAGSAKKGNDYHYHGQPKAIYLYPLDPDFRRHLRDDQR